MSKRRKIGDRVWLSPGVGFGQSEGEYATIIDWPSNQPDQLDPCMIDCGDPDCTEWNDLANDGKSFYHVSECEMFDAPPDPAESII